MTESIASMVRQRLQDLGARFVTSLYGDLTFAHLDGYTVIYRSRFSRLVDRGTRLSHVQVNIRGVESFALHVSKIATVDLEVRKRISAREGAHG